MACGSACLTEHTCRASVLKPTATTCPSHVPQSPHASLHSCGTEAWWTDPWAHPAAQHSTADQQAQHARRHTAHRHNHTVPSKYPALLPPIPLFIAPPRRDSRTKVRVVIQGGAATWEPSCLAYPGGPRCMYIIVKPAPAPAACAAGTAVLRCGMSQPGPAACFHGGSLIPRCCKPFRSPTRPPLCTCTNGEGVSSQIGLPWWHSLPMAVPHARDQLKGPAGQPGERIMPLELAANR
mmetsp:Transcript_26069/g.66307  ORF Transcript_26069/g.66307 Transcript_26069/m.66307 type:complete len:237 (+) Transcript_26069:102-812(+)